jgi:hypothetical protein
MLSNTAKTLADKYIKDKGDPEAVLGRSLQAEVNKISGIINSLAGNTNYSRKELMRVALKANELQSVITELLASK